jgi:quercetin dioxygenase-like cupin family protein
MKTIRILAAAVLLVGSGLALYVARAQQPGIRRTELLRHDLGIPGREVVQVRVELDSGVAFGKHTHPGAELAYVLSGSLEYQVEGKPPVTLAAGDVLFIPAGTVHAAKNVGSGNGVELATYIVEKGKPLVVPVAAPIEIRAKEVTSMQRSVPATLRLDVLGDMPSFDASPWLNSPPLARPTCAARSCWSSSGRPPSGGGRRQRSILLRSATFVTAKSACCSVRERLDKSLESESPTGRGDRR